MKVDELIQNLKDGNNVGANKQFNTVMADKMTAALDAKKIELAKSLGVPDEEEPEITDVEDEEEIEATDQEEAEDEEYEDDLDDGADEFDPDVETEEDIEAHDG